MPRGKGSGGSQGGGGRTFERGLAAADKETRERVAREGDKTSQGGGRSSESQSGRGMEGR